MKKLLSLAGLVFLFGCTEKGVEVTPRVEGGDTTFTAGVEPAQQRKVVMEEFTGVTCPNCPAGHTVVANLQAQYPGRLLAVSYYVNGLGQSKPVEGATLKDFRTEDATAVGSSIFGGVPSLPSASIDRVPVNGITLPAYNVWAGAVAARMAIASPANVQVTSAWESGDRTAIIRVRIAYTAPVSKKQALTLILVENDLVDAQEYPDRIDTFYTFKHVLRDVITSNTGEALLDEFSTKEAGRVYERTFVYPVSGEWNAERCRLVAILHNAEGSDREVVQAGEGKVVE